MFHRAWLLHSRSMIDAIVPGLLQRHYFVQRSQFQHQPFWLNFIKFNHSYYLYKAAVTLFHSVAWPGLMEGSTWSRPRLKTWLPAWSSCVMRACVTWRSCALCTVQASNNIGYSSATNRWHGQLAAPNSSGGIAASPGTRTARFLSPGT